MDTNHVIMLDTKAVKDGEYGSVIYLDGIMYTTFKKHI